MIIFFGATLIYPTHFVAYLMAKPTNMNSTHFSFISHHNCKMKHPTTLREKGHVEVGHSRQSAPIKLYYEMHGSGPEHVLLVMGNVNFN